VARVAAVLVVWGCVTMLAILLYVPELSRRRARVGRWMALVGLLAAGIDTTRQVIARGGLAAVEPTLIIWASGALAAVGTALLALNILSNGNRP
jgi:hypothetical protein